MNTGARPAPIVHVVAAGEIGGAERMLVRLAATGAGRAHVVALWTDDPALRALFVDAGLPVLTPPARPGSMLSARLRVSGGADVDWLAGELRAARAAAVHLHTFASHVVGTRAGQRARVPVVRTEHSRRVYDHWLCRPVSAWSLRRCARVVAVSDDLRRLVAGRFPAVADRLTVIPNGVPIPAQAPALPGDGPLRLCLVARLEPRKAIGRALRALARVPEAQLGIVGDGPLRGRLEALARALGLGPRVRFWGFRRDPETIVAASDAIVCSSRTEGLPMGLLEAMARGRPAIAVPVGGVPEIIDGARTGWLAAAPTTAALAEAIARAAAAGRAEIARRGAAARALVQHRFSDAQMRRAYEAVYRALPPSPQPAGVLAAERDVVAGKLPLELGDG